MEPEPPFLPVAGAEPISIWSELESAPAPRTAIARAAQKSGGSATLLSGTGTCLRYIYFTYIYKFGHNLAVENVFKELVVLYRTDFKILLLKKKNLS